MRTRRFELLDSAGLPFPRPLSPLHGDLPAGLLPPKIYLRQQSGERVSRVVTSAEYIELLPTGRLDDFSAVEFVPSIAGATTVAIGGAILVELAIGHLSGLLGHGYISTRTLIPSSKPQAKFTMTYKQSSMVDPESMTIVESRRHGVDFTAACASIAKKSFDAFGNAHLTEVMITPEGSPVWVDVKLYPWQIDFGALFHSERTVIYGEPGPIRQWHPKKWQPSAVPTALSGRSLAIGDHALTSHLVTYALSRGLDVLYNI